MLIGATVTMWFITVTVAEITTDRYAERPNGNSRLGQ